MRLYPVAEKTDPKPSMAQNQVLIINKDIKSSNNIDGKQKSSSLCLGRRRVCEGIHTNRPNTLQHTHTQVPPPPPPPPHHPSVGFFPPTWRNPNLQRPCLLTRDLLGCNARRSLRQQQK